MTSVRNIVETVTKTGNKKGFSFIEVIIVIAMILILTAVIVPSYIGFVEAAKESNIKLSAQNMYTSIQMAHVSYGLPDDSDGFLAALKKLNPAVVAVGIINNGSNGSLSLQKPVASNEFTGDGYTTFTLGENQCAVSAIATTDSGYSFTYYQGFGNKIYSAEFENGTLKAITSYDME